MRNAFVVHRAIILIIFSPRRLSSLKLSFAILKDYLALIINFLILVSLLDGDCSCTAQLLAVCRFWRLRSRVNRCGGFNISTERT